MFRTPQKMTRKTRRGPQEKLPKNVDSEQGISTNMDQATTEGPSKENGAQPIVPPSIPELDATSEPTRHVPDPLAKAMSSRRSQVSSKSSINIIKKKLQLEAEQRKARIEMALIDRETELKLAELEEETYIDYSPQIEEEVNRSQLQVQDWIENLQTTFEVQSATEVVEHNLFPIFPNHYHSP
ncbi:hypothetical protein O3G_MSEX008856 [Manduca sexta]|uniref:Uncharacterized protein n=1 Tax=Manduca sexta TaxID=7130 RepID=A0A921ZB57_MANSE|nr:hypothetical protein O3G_MSEX008856 [Manduca sexta]